ncbi:MAG: hypothetical protein HY860_01935, partial [Chlamydiales bacterium]|nr:hypothetical protein [Chlamydiales bacterium]
MCALIVSGMFLFCYFFIKVKDLYPDSDTAACSLNKRQESYISYPRGVIYSGPLLLHHENMQIPFPNLSEELVLIGRNDRPDASHKFLTLLLGLKHCGETKECILGDKSYLDFCNDMQSSLRFQYTKTPFWIVPIADDKNIKIISGLTIEDAKQKKII